MVGGHLISMKYFMVWGALALAPWLAAQNPAVDFEKEIAALVASPTVTVVHFWAPWCSNCQAELKSEGWAQFVAANPQVKFVFLNIWHKGQSPLPVLAAAGLSAQPNLLLRTHPNASRLVADRLNTFLGLPVTWIPTTWIFRDGKLRLAFNYGEVRFPVLQQMVNDAQNSWEH